LTFEVATTLLPSDRPLEKGQFVGTLRRLLGFARPYRRALWTSIGLALGAQAFELAVPWLTGDVIDQAIQPRDTDRLKTLIALMLAAAVLRFILMTIRRLVSGTMAVSIEYDLRNRTYAHLQKLSFSFFDRNQTGQLMSRATADVGTVRIFLSYGLLFFTQYILTIVGVLIVLLLTDPLLALVAVAIAPLIVYIAIRYSRVSHPVLTEAQQTLADVTTQAEEAVVGVRVVKAFGQEEREAARFRHKSERIFAVNVKANALRARYVPMLSFVPNLAVAGVLGFGGWMVVDGRTTLGDFVRFNLLLAILVMPLRMLGMWVGQAQRAVASGVRVLELLDLEPELADPPDPKPLPADGGGAIRFQGVRFGYEPDRPIVRDVDLDIPAGSTVALIGPTGCGKTTLTTLVPRFYDVTAGRVLVDGIDVRELSLVDLRRAIGVVTEDTFLFSATVRENIAFGAPWATDDDVRQAAERAQATEFIDSLPEGYETQIGERGLTLSGGQRQRIAIARALLVNPRILILDDATAAVDATTESKIKRALQELMRDRTTIIIAHRLSTISLAERVVVMDGGRVVADGSHEELAETSELYSRIRTHGLLDRTFVDLDGDRYVPPKEGEPVTGARERGSRLG
jgi:ABC-type multidrug transport system fused ATPase/permease subunit